MSECDHEAPSGEVVTRCRVAAKTGKKKSDIIATYLITMQATGFIRFKIMGLLPQDGGRQPKHVGETTVLL